MNHIDHFRRMFWRYFIVITIPIIAIGSTSMVYFFNRLAKDTKQLNLSIVEQTKEMMEISLSTLTSVVNQMRSDENIRNFARKSNVDSLELYETRNILSAYIKPGIVVYNDNMPPGGMFNIQYTKEDGLALERYIKSGSMDSLQKFLDKIYNANFTQHLLPEGDLKELIAKMVINLYDIIDETYQEQLEEREKLKRVCKNILQNNDASYSFAIIKEVCYSICETFAQLDDNKMHDDMLSYIEGNYMNPELSLNYMAEQMNFSYYHLSRLFKETVGINFTRYLMMVRLEKAREFLENTDMTVKQIAEKLGFQAATHLYVPTSNIMASRPGNTGEAKIEYDGKAKTAHIHLNVYVRFLYGERRVSKNSR